MALAQTQFDNFDDNSFNTSKWYRLQESGATVKEQNQRLELAVPNPSNSSSYAEMGANSALSMVGSYTFLQIIQIPNIVGGAGDSYAALEIKLDNLGNTVFWQVNQGKLSAIYQTPSSANSLYNVTFSSTLSWIRIRESSGTIYWDTSANGISWTQRASRSYSGVDMTASEIWVNFYTEAAYTNPGGFYIDNWNVSTASSSVVFDGEGELVVAPKAVYKAGVTFDGEGDLNAYSLNVTPVTKVERKTYMAKVYDGSDTFLGLWKDIITPFSYSQEINSSGSAVDIELARNSDSLVVSLQERKIHDGQLRTTNATTRSVAGTSKNKIGPGSNVDLNYRVDIYVFYGQQTTRDIHDGQGRIVNGGQERKVNIGSPNGRKIYSGYISRYISRYGSTETTLVSLLSFGDELDNYVIKDGENVVVPYLSQDPSDILTSVIDNFNSQGGVVTYDSSSIDNTNTVVSYEFKLNSTLEGVNKVLELAPSDWFWYVDLGENILHFHERPSEPSHYFILGKHIEELNLEKYIEDITNDVYVSGGDTGSGENLFVHMENTTSQTTYRKGLKRISDSRLTQQDSAEIIAQGELDRNSQPQFRSNVTILSEVYDIEDIRLGQTVAFRNFGNYVDLAVMQIVGLDYEPDRVKLQLDTLLPRVSKRLEDIKRNLNALNSLDNPDTPT